MNLNLDNLPKSVELGRDGSGLLFSYLDERLLPGQVKICATRDWRAVVQAVKTLAVRGAPAIGLAGASALALWADGASDLEGLDAAAGHIASARPTAVNLRWAVDRALAAVRGRGCTTASQAACVLFELVRDMQDEDEACNRAIGAHGAALLGPDSRILTHCNAGSLGTYFYGTALGIVYAAAERGKVQRVYADETRPVGQGARLTVWELSRVGIPTTLICDNMAASLMAAGSVDAVVVGADRIAANGDTANKIGTYGVAILAHAHGIPFYVAAPTSTIDRSIPDGSHIVIEQRDAREVLPDPIDGVDVWNPAFDVTPARYITKIITEQGVFDPDCL
ncbi:MAG TPA: S-methyl-5-thioribose-1-phosphate isomerase [Eggerthellaceae bacterium]|nr:S-methyl-5-thioribose-1-phosphate isomerase [Eggerthellaceae bacterium]